jgi:hypothetical protein
MEPQYALEGHVLEVTAPPGLSMTVWKIERGCINGVEVQGSIVVALTHRGLRPEASVRVVLLEEEATPQQALALVDGFRGRLGGPLAELADQAIDRDGFAQVPIKGWIAREGSVVWVPDRFHVFASFGPLFRRPQHPAPPGPGVTDVGTAFDFGVELPEYGLRWQGQDALATYRSFCFAAGADTRSLPSALCA